MQSNVFRDANATAEQLVEAYLFFETKEGELRKSLEAASNQLVQLQTESLMGTNVSKELKQAKELHTDLGFQIRACESAQETLIGRLCERLPLEAQAEVNLIDSEIWPELQAEREQLFQEYAAALGRAIALKEALDGRRGEEYHRDFYSIVNYDFCWERFAPFIEVFKTARAEYADKESIVDRSRALHQRQEKLKKVIEEPDKAVEMLLQTAGAKAFQPRPRQDEQPANFVEPARTENHPSVGVDPAVFMGYREAPLPKLEYPRCWSEGHDFGPDGNEQLCRRCSELNENWKSVATSAPIPEAQGAALGVNNEEGGF